MGIKANTTSQQQIGLLSVTTNMIPINYKGKEYLCPYGQSLPPLTTEVRQALKNAIQFDGVRVPITVDENGNVIDGRNRLEIAVELNLNHVPMEIAKDLSEEQKHALALEMNLLRRQSTRENLQNAIKAELKRAPNRSDRSIAANLAVNHKTVGKARKDLESTGEIPQYDLRKSTNGSVRSSCSNQKGDQAIATRLPCETLTASSPDQRAVIAVKLPAAAEESVALTPAKESRATQMLPPASADSPVSLMNSIPLGQKMLTLPASAFHASNIASLPTSTVPPVTKSVQTQTTAETKSSTTSHSSNAPLESRGTNRSTEPSSRLSKDIWKMLVHVRGLSKSKGKISVNQSLLVDLLERTYSFVNENGVNQ